MKLDDIRNISIIGAGIMGHGIAQVFALGGYAVCLNDAIPEALERAMVRIRENLRIFTANGFVTEEEAAVAFGRITTEPNLDQSVKNADIVIEAVKENAAIKQALFEHLDAVCPAHTILASNSSSLLISEFGSTTKRQDKMVLAHWYNPPHIVPAVEVIRGAGTSDETADLMYDILKKVKKLPVRINKEIPGYLLNRIQMALVREAWYLWQAGVASAEDIDLAVKGSIGFRLASIGPLLTSDLGGQDTFCAVAQYLFPLISDAHTPPESYVKMVEGGDLGMKTGKGFYNYSKEEWDAVIEKRDKEFLQRLKNLYWE